MPSPVNKIMSYIDAQLLEIITIEELSENKVNSVINGS